jgi:hypothetical protein
VIGIVLLLLAIVTVITIVVATLQTGKQADKDMGCYDDEMDNQ